MFMADLKTGTEIIDRQECFELLATEEVGRLSIVLAGQPEIFPVNYAVDGDGIVFRTDAGTKLTGSIRSPVVFEVDHLDRTTRSAWSVVLHGRAHHVNSYDEPSLQRRVSGLAVDPWVPAARPFLVRITPTTVTGRRVGRHMTGRSRTAARAEPSEKIGADAVVRLHLVGGNVATMATVDLDHCGRKVTGTGEARAYPSPKMHQVTQDLAVSRALDDLARKLRDGAAEEYEKLILQPAEGSGFGGTFASTDS